MAREGERRSSNLIGESGQGSLWAERAVSTDRTKTALIAPRNIETMTKLPTGSAPRLLALLFI